MPSNDGLFSITRFLYGWPKTFTNKNIFSKRDLHVLFISFFSKIYNKRELFIAIWSRPFPFLYKVSIVVLIDFIAILLSPGIFLIQIVNTNMYLIHFHSRNIIKICFPKVGFLKFQTYPNHSLSITTEIKCFDISKDFTTMLHSLIFKKKIRLIIIIYIVYNVDIFWCIIQNNFFNINENENWTA